MIIEAHTNTNIQGQIDDFKNSFVQRMKTLKEGNDKPRIQLIQLILQSLKRA